MKIMGKYRRVLIWVCVLAAVGIGAYYYFAGEASAPVEYRTSDVEKRDMVLTIDATGTVEPEELVNVGARVSGEIVSFGKDNAGRYLRERLLL